MTNDSQVDFMTGVRETLIIRLEWTTTHGKVHIDWNALTKILSPPINSIKQVAALEYLSVRNL